MTARDLTIRSNKIIPSAALSESFILSSGPGGQNVNKVSTAVQLRFNAIACVDLFTSRQFEKLIKLAGNKATNAGEILIEASRFRSQERNREDARDRLKELILAALVPPPAPRKTTRPSKGAIERRLKAKSGRGEVKKNRGQVRSDD